MTAKTATATAKLPIHARNIMTTTVKSVPVMKFKCKLFSHQSFRKFIRYIPSRTRMPVNVITMVAMPNPKMISNGSRKTILAASTQIAISGCCTHQLTAASNSSFPPSSDIIKLMTLRPCNPI